MGRRQELSRMISEVETGIRNGKVATGIREEGKNKRKSRSDVDREVRASQDH